MIAPLPPTDPTIVDTFVDDGALVTYHVNPNAERGDVIGPLASLLIDMDRRRQQREQVLDKERQ